MWVEVGFRFTWQGREWSEYGGRFWEGTIPEGKLGNRYCSLPTSHSCSWVSAQECGYSASPVMEFIPAPIPRGVEAQLRAMIKEVKIQLILEQNRLEVHGSTFTQIFFQ